MLTKFIINIMIFMLLFVIVPQTKSFALTMESDEPIAIAANVNTNAQSGSFYLFNTDALEIGNPNPVSRTIAEYVASGQFPPGIYRTDIYINGRFKGQKDLDLREQDDGTAAFVLEYADLIEWGVNPNYLKVEELPDNITSHNISRIIPQAAASFDGLRSVLNISIPQLFMMKAPRGGSGPADWDYGLPAFMMNYNFNGSQTRLRGSGTTQENNFLSLDSGINLGKWQFRNQSTWTSNSGNYANDSSSNDWQSINTYAQRDLPSVMGRLTVGDRFTPSEVFDSFQFRGLQVASEQAMLPESQQGFAPTVRGVANSEARVTVKQDGVVIYEESVSAGPFVINDLYPSASSGNLEVVVTESDGSERRFFQPFSRVPVMQREGRLNYAFTAGRYRSNFQGIDEPFFAQGAVLYGYSNTLTLFGGAQIAEDYYSGQLGVGIGLGAYGSISLSAQHAEADLSDFSDKGQSYRFQYSKNISTTNSTLTLASYRYSTSGFYTLQEAVRERVMREQNLNAFQPLGNQKSIVQLSLSQGFDSPRWGSFTFSGFERTFWDSSGHERALNLSYGNALWGATWRLNYNHTKFASNLNGDNQQLSLNVSIPLGRRVSNAYANFSVGHDLENNYNTRAGLSGTALRERNLSYNLSHTYNNTATRHRNGSQFGMNYKGSYGEVGGGYSDGNGARRLNYSARGAASIHPFGVTFSQPLAINNGGMVLVKAPGASAVNVRRGVGVSTDWRGYTVVPFVSPYRESQIMLDTSTFDRNVDIQNPVLTATPAAGAFAVANYQTNMGYRVLFTVTLPEGNIPFGSMAAISQEGATTGIVDQNEQVYLSGVPETGALEIRWGQSPSEQCIAEFSIPATEGTPRLREIEIECLTTFMTTRN